jgi:predicted nucleic acid-binding protein
LEMRYAGRCYLPDEVRIEIERGEAAHGHNCEPLLRAAWWKPGAIEQPEDHALFFQLLQAWGRTERNRGEAAAIVVARRLGAVAVVDDLQGRRAAQRHGIPVIGTVAILARMIAERQMSLAEGWVIHTDMVRLGFRSPIRSQTDFELLVNRIAAQ